MVSIVKCQGNASINVYHQASLQRGYGKVCFMANTYVEAADTVEVGKHFGFKFQWLTIPVVRANYFSTRGLHPHRPFIDCPRLPPTWYVASYLPRAAPPTQTRLSFRRRYRAGIINVRLQSLPKPTPVSSQCDPGSRANCIAPLTSTRRHWWYESPPCCGLWTTGSQSSRK
jgi:hypothetical protein